MERYNIKNVEKNVEKQVDSELLEDVVSALCNTGYKKLDAKKKAKEAINIIIIILMIFQTFSVLK